MARLNNIENLGNKRPIFSIFWFILRQMWRSNKKTLILAIIATFLMASLQFANSFSFAQIINILTGGNPTWQKIIPYLALIALFDYLPFVFSSIEASLNESIDRILRIDLEQMIFKKLSTLDIATIEQPDFQDTLYQVQSRGISAIIAVNFWLFILIKQTFKIIISLSILFTLSKIGLLVIVLSAIPMYFYEQWRGRKLSKIFESQTETNRKIGSKISAFTNKDSLIEVKFFNLGNYFLEKIKVIRSNHHEVLTKDAKTFIPIYAGFQLLPQAGILVSAVTVIRDVIRGIRPVGTLTFVWSTLWQFSNAFQQILRSVGRLEEHGSHASKLINMLAMDSFVSENPNGILYEKKVAPKIEFRNVSFAYPGSDTEVLKNINFTIHPGSETALVGLNGAGKTTLLRLLSRVYDPTGGQILVNEIDLREYKLESWRNILSIMLQDYSVYQDESIKENITFAHGNEDMDSLNKVVKETGVMEYSEKYASKLDQMIGKEYRGGIELSKGQKQKLVLARTLYQNHPFIILDEPTSAIDAVSEDTIFKSIRENYKDKTRIIISHKFSNVRDADLIILVGDGMILEQGTHEELVKIKKGEYAKLFKLQAEGYK